MFQLALAFLAFAAPSARFDAATVGAHVQYLADPKLEGRMTLSRGEDLAAAYIANHFRKIGLQEGPNKGYMHEWEVSFGYKALPSSRLSVTTADGKTIVGKLGSDFVPLVGTKTTPATGEVVFVGYGSEDAYEGKDLKGKIALVLRGMPQGSRPMTNGAKAQVAAAQGAVGVIFAGPAQAGRAELPPINRGSGVREDSNLAAVAVTSSMLRTMTGLTLDQARAGAAPTVKGVRVTLSGSVEPNKGMSKNVMGYLPGRDPKLKNEFVIIGAHYDHVGFGETGSMSGSDAIHTGADDNASGTAAVMELASYFAKAKNNRRTMIFQLYSGEEIGLMGSRAWANFNTDTLAKTTAMINLDMVGRLRDGKLTVYGTSSADEFNDLLAKIDTGSLELAKAPNVRFDSDHAAFAAKKVPVLFFHTGLHPEYHTERDQFSTINVEGIAQTCEVVANVLTAIDKIDKQLAFSPNAVMGNAPGDRSPTGDSRRRVRVGFMPDMGAEGPGVRITGASPDSPAAKAGFKAGDRIIQFGGKKVDSLEDLQEAMNASKVGDKVKVRYIRDGKEAEAELTVEGRSG